MRIKLISSKGVELSGCGSEAFADPHPSNKTGHHHHHHHHHDHGRGSSHSATNEPSNGHGHQRTAPSNSQSPWAAMFFLCVWTCLDVGFPDGAWDKFCRSKVSISIRALCRDT